MSANVHSVLQISVPSSSSHDLCRRHGFRALECRGLWRLDSEAGLRQRWRAGVGELAEILVLEELGRGEAPVEREGLGRVTGRGQHSGYVKRRKKEPPNDLLHNLARAVALRVASEDLKSDEDVMQVVNDTGLRVNVRSMNRVVWQLGQMQNWHAATKVFRAFRTAGVEPNAYVCTTLIAALG